MSGFLTKAECRGGKIRALSLSIFAVASNQASLVNQHHINHPDITIRPAPIPQTLSMADKLRTLQQLESLQAKYVGTGHADTTRYEWSNNIVRDSYASYVGHPPLLAYMALGMGESKEVVRGQMIEKMIRASGPPPAREED